MSQKSLEVMANSMKQMETLFIKQMEDFSSRIEQCSTPNKATTASLATELAAFRTFIMGALKILQDQFQALSRDVDSLEMRSRRKMLLLHGVPEVKGEKTDEVIVQTVVQKLKVVGFTNTAISRCHRMGRPNSADHPRPILLKLCESEVRHRFGVAKCWTQGGNIVILGSDGIRHRISHQQDLDRLICQLEGPKPASAAVREPAAAPVAAQKPRRAAASGKK